MNRNPGNLARFRAPLAAGAILAAVPAAAAPGSHEALAVSARIITSCRMGSAARPNHVTVRCTGEVALQAGAAAPPGLAGATLKTVQGMRSSAGGVRHTVLEADLVGEGAGEPTRVVTVMF